MTNSPSHQPESEPNNKNGDSQLSSTGTHNHTTSNGHTQQPRWKTLIEEKKAEMARAAREAEATQTKRNPAGQAVAPEIQRGSRPSEQHSSRPKEEETLNGVTHPESYADAIPDVNTDKPESVMLSDSIVENVIGHADPLTVFPRWGKGDTPRDTSGDEVQFRCPTPGHTDTNPSASINVKTGLWVCFGCEAGGDIYTLGGIKFGMDEHSSELPELKRRMAEDLTGKPFIEHGPYSVIDIPAVRELVDAENKERERREAEDNRALQESLREKELEKERYESGLDEYMRELNESLYGDLVPEPEPRNTAPTVAPDPAPSPDSPAPVPDGQGPHTDDAASDAGDSPAPTQRPQTTTLNNDSLMVPPDDFTGYDDLLKPGTFLSEFYNSCKKDSNPNDFHFFNGLAGLGFASGRNVTLGDERPVMGNLFLCFVAGTGSGKSNAGEYLEHVLEAGLPWDENSRDGVKIIGTPGSGEVLIDQMTDKSVVDPITGAVTNGRVKGYLKYDELSKLVKQGARQGSTIADNLTSMYDGSTASAYSRGAGKVKATEPFLTMTSNIPPETMRELFTSGAATSGFLNRFTLISTSKRKPQKIFNETITPDYDYLGSKLHEIAKWAGTPAMVRPDDEALELLEQFFNIELAQYSGRLSSEVDPMMVRIELMFKKFCLLFAVNEMSHTLTRDHVEKAIKLYWIAKPGFVKTSESVGKSAEAELEDAIVEKVTAYFIKHSEPLTAGQIWGEKLQIGKREAKRLGIERRGFDYALRNLVNTDELDEVKPPKGDNRTKLKYKPGS